MITTRALYNRNGQIDRFVPQSSTDAGGVTRIDPPPTATRVPIKLIVLVLVFAAAANAIGIIRYQSGQPAAQSLQLDSPGLRTHASAGVVVSGAERGR